MKHNYKAQKHDSLIQHETQL